MDMTRATTCAVQWNGSSVASLRATGLNGTTYADMQKMKARATLAAAVMMAMALGQVRSGRQQQMRSLVRPIPVLDTG